MSRYLYALVPLLVLLLAIALACVVAYGIEYYFDPAWTLRKIIRKLSQVFLLLSIIPAMIALKLNYQALGFAEKSVLFKQLRLGFVIGIITLLPVFIVLYGLGLHVVDATQPWTWLWISKKLVVELLLALLVSIFEEPVFRGIVLVGLLRKLPIIPAVTISAFYYAILHFLDSKTPIDQHNLTLLSGFKLMAESFSNLLNPTILSTFLSLFMVGLFLGLLRTQWPASLGLCIGCHTGWVWQIKLSKTFLNTHYQSDYAYLISHYDGVIGPLVTIWLAAALLVYGIYQYSSKANQ